MKLTKTITLIEEKMSINEYLKTKLHFSTRLLKKLIKTQNILVNNKFQNTNTLLKNSDILTIDFSYFENNSHIPPYNVPIKILYEDEFLLIVDKPPHIPVHQSSSCFNESLSNMVKAYFDSIHLKKLIRPVNRLDLNTSGIVIFAKCEYIQECLKNSILKKQYLCFCEGSFPEKSFTIDKPIARKDGSILEREIHIDGKTAITDFTVINTFNANSSICYSLLKCSLHTGRTHQIRVHLNSILHPILGDTLYGSTSNYIARQALHNYYTEFIHPITKEKIAITSSLPEDMKKLQIL